MSAQPNGQPQVPPEQVNLRPPPFTHIEVQPGPVPNTRLLVILDRVNGRQQLVVLHADYAAELGKELSAPHVVVANGNGHP